MPLYMSRVTLKNVRCFKDIDWKFSSASSPVPWTMVLGDNSTGKTTLLRCIAMGLCDESSAAGLLKESYEGLVRRKARRAEISIYLLNGEGNRYEINTSITKRSEGKSAFEQLTQTTKPSGNSFPWGEIFVAGYGASRGSSGTGDIAGYYPINATYNLFNYGEGLQNPELVLRRTRTYRKPAYRLLEQFLHLESGAVSLRPKQGLHVSGNWGKGMPLRDLADGYKSSILWFTDLIGWIIDYSGGSSNHDLSKTQGIVLVDELEQHLHPSWQRTIVASLRTTLPNIQFITTTHSELIARSVGRPEQLPSVSDDQLMLCYSDSTSRAVKVKRIGTIEKLDSVQALQSNAFSLPSVDSSGVQKFLKRYDDLLKKTTLTASQKVELSVLKKYFSSFDLLPGGTELDRKLSWEIYREVLKALNEDQNKRMENSAHSSGVAYD